MKRQGITETIIKHWLEGHNWDSEWCNRACLAKTVFGYNNRVTRLRVLGYVWEPIARLCRDYKEIVLRAHREDAGWEAAFQGEGRKNTTVAWKFLRSPSEYEPYLSRQIQRNKRRGEIGLEKNVELNQLVLEKHLPPVIADKNPAEVSA